MVTLAAVQAGDLGCKKRFNCLHEGFELNLNEIMKHHVMPRLEMHVSLLESCVGEGTVLALTIEDICGLSHFLLADRDFFDELVQVSAEMAESRISALASKTGMYIAACYYKRYFNLNYNLVSIFAPSGEIVGEYRKTHIPPNEMWHLADGNDLNVIELEFGKVGVLICYDMMFPEAASVLALGGAEIILHPTAGYGWYDAIGEATLKTRANDNSVYILTAKNFVHNAAGKSSIIDPWGQVLVDAGFYKDEIVSKTIDLNRRKTQPDWFYQSVMSGTRDIRERTVQERRPELYNSLVSPAKRLRVPDEMEREVLRDKVRKRKCRW